MRRLLVPVLLVLLCGCSNWPIPEDAIHELHRLNDNLEHYRDDAHKLAEALKKIEEHIKWIRREVLEKKDE